MLNDSTSPEQRWVLRMFNKNTDELLRSEEK